MINMYSINNYLYKKFSNINFLYQLREYEEQKRILDTIEKKFFKETYFYRSYCQYLCQKEHFKQNHKLLNLISYIVILFFIILLLIKKKPKKELTVEIIYFGTTKTIPRIFMSKKKLEMEKKFFLKREDIMYFWKDILKKAQRNYYFCLKILLKMAIYSYNIEKYSPRILLVTSEYSFTSSLLTEFCERNKVKHINYMHGEKIYEIRSSFFRFHKCYVWDEHYRNLFIKLKAYKEQFEVINYIEFIPKINFKDNSKLYNTYYLQCGETEIEIRNIILFLKKLEKKTGYAPKIRCHPVYTENRIKKIIPSDFIDNEENIYESIEKSYYVISKFSTVLYEASILNLGIIVVDDTNKLNYNALKSLDWIILKSRNYLQLSTLLKE